MLETKQYSLLMSLPSWADHNVLHKHTSHPSVTSNYSHSPARGTTKRSTFGEKKIMGWGRFLQLWDGVDPLSGITSEPLNRLKGEEGTPGCQLRDAAYGQI